MSETNTAPEIFYVQINEEEEWDYSYSTVIVVQFREYQCAWYNVDCRRCDYVSNNWPADESTLEDMEEAFSQVRMHLRLKNPLQATKLERVTEQIDGHFAHQEWLDKIELPF